MNTWGGSVHINSDAHGGKSHAPSRLALELTVSHQMWMLGTELFLLCKSSLCLELLSHFAICSNELTIFVNIIKFIFLFNLTGGSLVICFLLELEYYTQATSTSVSQVPGS